MRGMESADKETKGFKLPDPAIKKLGTRSQKPSVLQGCYCCGRSNHKPADGKFKNAQCHSCGKMGHIASVCRSKSPKPKEEHVEHHSTKKTHHLQGNEQSSDDDASSDSEFLLYKVGSRSSDPITVSVLLNGKELAMEVDTGAALSVISESTQQSVFPK